VRYAPATHGVGAAAPAPHQCPGGHGLQAASPATSAKEPAAHAAHAAADAPPGSALAVPGAHGVAAAAAAPHQAPAGHAKCVASGCAAVPAGQSSPAAQPNCGKAAVAAPAALTA
jgi:hypothetical protein